MAHTQESDHTFSADDLVKRTISRAGAANLCSCKECVGDVFLYDKDYLRLFSRPKVIYFIRSKADYLANQSGTPLPQYPLKDIWQGFLSILCGTCFLGI